MYPKPKVSTSLDTELAEALKTNDYSDCIRRLDQYYGQGLQKAIADQCMDVLNVLNIFCSEAPTLAIPEPDDGTVPEGLVSYKRSPYQGLAVHL